MAACVKLRDRGELCRVERCLFCPPCLFGCTGVVGALCPARAFVSPLPVPRHPPLRPTRARLAQKWDHTRVKVPKKKKKEAQAFQHSPLPPQTLLPLVCVGTAALKHMLPYVNTHTLQTQTHQPKDTQTNTDTSRSVQILGTNSNLQLKFTHFKSFIWFLRLHYHTHAHSQTRTFTHSPLCPLC